jgi:cell volume regulation protein A
VLIQAEGAPTMFNIVFFIVLVSTIVPGATVRWLTAFLGLQANEQPPPPALLEIISTRVLSGAEIASFSINHSTAACGAQISELPLPAESTLILLIRDSELIPPRGSTVLQKDDHVYVLCRPEDRPIVHLIFGHSEED